MKKIIYLTDYDLNAKNSVSEINNNIIDFIASPNLQQVVMLNNGYSFNLLCRSEKNGYKHYFVKDIHFCDVLSKQYWLGLKCYLLFKIIKRKIHIKIAEIFNSTDKYLTYAKNRCFRKVIKKEKPDIFVFFTDRPYVNLIDVCLKKKINYIYVLYDTFIGNPKIDAEKEKPKEKYVIDNSYAYFVPSFFYGDYIKHYSSDKIISFDLPLLIDKCDVENAYRLAEKNKYGFAYFGQIQQFRNGDKIKEIFKKLNSKLDIWSTNGYLSDDIFIAHNAVVKEELYNIIVGSKFLVAFDNSVPYDRYLPSKAYLYVSFTKPVIAFGDNKNSALIEFFKDYPYFYYQDINGSLDGLKDFLNKDFSKNFDEEIYNRYLNYGEENALVTIREKIFSLLGDLL